MQLGVSAHIAAVVPFILGAGEVGTGSMVCDVLWLLFGGYKMVPKQCGSYPLPTVADYLFIDFLQSDQGAELYIPSTVDSIIT